MNLKLPILSGILLAILGVACNETEPLIPEQNTPNTRSAVYPESRSLEEALEYADEWFSQMKPTTRSSSRRIKSVEYITSAVTTRSSSADTLMYLVNYADNLYRILKI